MFNAGVKALLNALPALADLDEAGVRRLLAGAWLDAVRHQDFSGPDAPGAAGDLRRLATAVEVRLFVGGGLSAESRRASAFVAAEALGVVRQLNPSSDEPEPLAFGSIRRFEVVEEALLYLTAGFDANAALTSQALDAGGPTIEAEMSDWTLARIRALLDHTTPVPADDVPPAADGAALREAVRHELWRRIGAAVGAQTRWLRMLDDEDPEAGRALRALAGDLRDADATAASAHADLNHLCLLLAGACDETSARALRRVPSPPGDEGRFVGYQRQRAKRMPLLWPAAAEYAYEALPGPTKHAVVAVPTGAGKSSVAEMAAAQALQSGWVLYLAPTNALVAQVRRDLTRSIGSMGVAVRGFTGGAEYTRAAGETLEDITEQEILVMTPEKCSLALRQNPEAFASLSLCVLDEAHLIGDARSRGVVAELVLAEVLHRSPNVRVLLLSALLENPAVLAGWLASATGTEAVAIEQPWRPTRTLRALCGVDAERTAVLAAEAREAFADLAPTRRNVTVRLPLRLLGALHGTWTGEDPGDYEIVDTSLSVPAKVNRSGRVSDNGHTAPTTRALTQALAEAGHRVLVFLPADRHAPFSYARALTGPGPGDPANRVEAASLLRLADAEIAGVEAGPVSEVHDAIDKGLAIHSSAMLPEEQRASEVAFESGAASVMLATGTLAQGLNLPATAVVIGGTSVGDRREANTTEGRARAKAQLLNAIGRAGRAQTAARSLAIVVPNAPVRVGASPQIAQARRSAAFLAEEDGSTRVASRLDGLIASSLSDSLDLHSMSVPEQTAFAFLSFTAESGDATAVLSRSLAAHAAGAADRAQAVTDALRALGRRFLDDEHAPAWVATAAHRAGVTLPAAAALERQLRAILTFTQVSRVNEWARFLIGALSAIPGDVRSSLLSEDNLASTAVAEISSADETSRTAAWQAMLATVDMWLDGRPLTEVGAALHATEPPIGSQRTKGAQLPRTLRFVNNAIEHDLTTIAGAAVAIVVTGLESDPQGPWALPEASALALGRLPVAMRSGAANPDALALLQLGLRPRVAAHLLAERSPSGVDDDAGRRRWALRILDEIADPDLIDQYAGTPDERAVLIAAAYVRATR